MLYNMQVPFSFNWGTWASWTWVSKAHLYKSMSSTKDYWACFTESWHWCCGFLLREQYGKKLKLVEVQNSWATERKWTLGFNIREKMLLILPSVPSEENLGQDWKLWQKGGFGWKEEKKFAEILQCSAIKYRTSKNNLGEKWGTEVLKKTIKCIWMQWPTYKNY